MNEEPQDQRPLILIPADMTREAMSLLLAVVKSDHEHAGEIMLRNPPQLLLGALAGVAEAYVRELAKQMNVTPERFLHETGKRFGAHLN